MQNNFITSHSWNWLLLLIIVAASPPAVRAQQSSGIGDSPEAQRFRAEKQKSQQRDALCSYVISAKQKFESAWQSWHTPAQNKLLITKVRETVNSGGKIASAMIVVSSGLPQEDSSVQECLNRLNFGSLPVGINSVDLFWTVMTDGSLNMVECTDSEEANQYNSNMLGGILPPKGDSLVPWHSSTQNNSSTARNPSTNNPSTNSYPSTANNPGPATSQPSQAAQANNTDDFGPYMADLQRRLKRAWFPPKGHEMDKVTVQFKVLRDGALSSCKVVHSAGEPISDQAALQAVQNASPFGPLPLGAADLNVNFTFDFNVFSRSRHP